MSANRISARYAKSLMDLAIERNELEAVKADVDLFTKALESRDLYLLLKSPIINASKKSDVIHAIFDAKLGKTMLAFLNIIIRKGREMYMPEIAKEFLFRYKTHNKISTVVITTASEPGETFLADIKKTLLASHITMDKLEVVTKVDPALIGGFIIEVGDKLYDASIAHKLDSFRQVFEGNQYVKSL